MGPCEVRRGFADETEHEPRKRKRVQNQIQTQTPCPAQHPTNATMRKQPVLRPAPLGQGSAYHLWLVYLSLGELFNKLNDSSFHSIGSAPLR